jgi:hypothetical protein
MSKQSEAKEAQGWVKKPLTCKQCKHRTSKMEWPAWMLEPGWEDYLTDDRHKVEKEIRCGLGGFKVGNGAACDALDPTNV